MARGWDQGSGELSPYFFDLDKYWTKFRYVFSDACRKRTTYKFALIKSIIDSLYSAEYTSHGMKLPYSKVFAKFTENYWNLITKHEVCQIIPDGKTNVSRIEKLILQVRDRNVAFKELNYEDLSVDEQIQLVEKVQEQCSQNVMGALFMDFADQELDGKFRGTLYGFSNAQKVLWLHMCAYEFLMKHKLEIEQLNYMAWAKFLEKINKNVSQRQIIEKLELATPKRSNLSVYRNILREEFEENNCFYCGTKLSSKSPVDHVIPWSFVKSDHLWNFALACPSCNSKKSNLLPSKSKLAEIEERNKKMIVDQDPFVMKEMEGYTKDLMWNLWDYASMQGYKVFEIS